MNISILRAAVSVAVLSISTCCVSQGEYPAHDSVIHRFVDGYNTADYKMIRGTMSGIMRAVFSEKMLKGMFGSQYEAFGRASISNVRYLSPSSAAVELVYEKDPTEIKQMRMSFNSKSRLVGFGSPSDKFQFSKAEGPIVHSPDIAQRIDSLMLLKHNTADFSGCVLALSGDSIIYKGCYGNSDNDLEIPLNDSSVFELASCSKQFTAMAIMILAEQKKLAYHDDVRDYLPEFPYKDITIEHLLTHTSGVPDYMELMDRHWDKSQVASSVDVLELLAEHTPKKIFKPGTKFEYSNTGYALLSVIIERASGMSFAQFLSKSIFLPLDMKHSRVYNTRRNGKEVINNYAYGYVLSDSAFVIPDSLAEYDFVRYMDGITGDGTVNSSITDLAKWEMALHNNVLVHDSTLARAFTPYKLKSGETSMYGYGWTLVDTEKYEPVVHHSGGWPGYITFIAHFPGQDISVVVLSNNEYKNTPRTASRISAMMLNSKKL